MTPSLANAAATASDLPADDSVASRPAPSGRYALGDEIARGGMGVIYRATDTALDREVAVKVLQDHFAPDSGVARRFAGEARIAAQLQHPAIPPVHDLGTLPDGRPFLAMKLIKGQTLDALLRARPDLSAERGRFVAIVEQVCQAIAYAHAHNVIHRDLKPENVMVGAFGEVQVMDWGLAKVLTDRPAAADPLETTAETRVVSLRDSDGSFTQAGSVLGTPAFMPPEQAIGAIGKVDRRSDVFGLGAILAVILTGRPPFTAASAETTRVKAARGKVEECFARLDACGADPELLALCKRCLAPEPADRPTDAGDVARAVAALRAAADERARRAELDKVRLEGEQAAAEARALERRKRRRLWLGAAAALVLAALAGLSAVLAVQKRANIELEGKNTALAEEQAKVEARFGTALKAIATFHTGVSEDALLKNDELTELRTKLLKEAAGFYTELEQLLAGQTDAKSRKLLADSFYQLGTLTEQIGDKKQALAVHRKSLELRRELASDPGADVETRLDVPRSLRAVGRVLFGLNDVPGAMAVYEEQRDLAAALEAESPTGAARQLVAVGYFGTGSVLHRTGKMTEALAATEKARDLLRPLAEASPDSTRVQIDLATSHLNIGYFLVSLGKATEGLKSYEDTIAVYQRLAAANPGNQVIKNSQAHALHNLGFTLSETGRLEEGLKAIEQARAIRQALATDYPSVSEYQRSLAQSHHTRGYLLAQAGKPEEALKSYEAARSLNQQLVGAHPTVSDYQAKLAGNYTGIAEVLTLTGKLAAALEAGEAARTIYLQLIGAHPNDRQHKSELAQIHRLVGDLHAGQGHWSDAAEPYRQANVLMQELIAADANVARYQSGLASSLSKMGMVQRHLQRPAEAVASFRRAIATQERRPTLPPVEHYNLACYYALLAGVAGESGSGMSAQEAKEIANQAMAKLRRAVAAGYRNLANMKQDTDLDALRARPDFQLLMKDLEKPPAPRNALKPPAAPKKD
ncbi:MAG TPA: serine/threonine-protein kinase [Gemmataceae bacterium]|jgi:tetratricopeptide (TPR) repeat protein